MGNKIKDITGIRFGRLTAQSIASTHGKGARWLCLCDCGKTHVVALGNLCAGSVQSCGCLHKELSAERCKRIFTKPRQSCSVEGCTNDTSKGGHGLCGKHRLRFRRYGDTEYVTPEAVRRVLSRVAQLGNVQEVKTTTYRKYLGRHQHRAVMEQHLGRRLGPDEIVHHIDGDRHNNALANLVVLSRAEHARIHFRKKPDT